MGRTSRVASRESRVATTPFSQPTRRVALRIQPRVGDTLRMRFEQTTQAAGPAANVETARTRTSSVHVVSRSVVERSDAAGTVVLTVTDSAAFETPGADPRQLAEAGRSVRGRWARVRISPAGGMEMIAPVPRPGELLESFARLPGTLPDAPVVVGATWTREMALPLAGSMPADGGRLQVVLRLDSLGGDGTLAYVSMHGALARAGVAKHGARVATSGTMEGYLLVDLRRGWMTDSRATFTMRSTLTPAPGSSNGKPMQLRVTITQRLHCAS